jgi:multidrug efflux pump subunit AcrA (membrane-fusion protein)
MNMQPNTETTTQPAPAASGNGQSLPAAPTPPAPQVEPVVSAPLWQRIVSGVIVFGVLIAFTAYVLGVQFPSLYGSSRDEGGKEDKDQGAALGVSLVDGRAHTLDVSDDARKALGMIKGKREMFAVAVPPSVMRPLLLAGSTALDPTRLARIRCRFATGRVVKIGQTNDFSPKTGQTEVRELRPGDYVRKGDVLAVFYSVDVGSKKNDLLDALVQLELDQKTLDAAEKHREAISEVQWLTFLRAVQGDRNAINRALNNLELWDIPQKEIDDLHAEAKKISADKNAWLKTREGRWVNGDKGTEPLGENPWGKVTLRAPFDGIIVERNLHVDEMIVDQTVNLFQIADVNRMLIIANAPEDDLPTLEALKHKKPWWSVRTVGAAATRGQFKLTDRSFAAMSAADVPATVLAKLQPLQDREFAAQAPFVLELARILDRDELLRYQKMVLELADTNVLLGPIEEVGYLVDPNQHTAIIKGYVDNPGQRLRAGQYVAATVRVPPPAGVVEVPISAVVDDGKQSLVFVQADASRPRYTMRRVQVTHRFDQRVFVRSTPIPKEEQLTFQEAEEGLLPREPLLPGERVLSAGVGELKAALLNLESQLQKK